MRKNGELKIEGIAEPIKIYELRVKDIYGIFSEVTSKDKEMTPEVMKEVAEKWLPKATDLTIEQMMEMAPSELELVGDKFKEINGSFFKIAQKLGLTDLLMGLKEAVMIDLNTLFADSFSEAMTRGGSGITGGPIS